MKDNPYKNFLAMLVVAFVVMYIIMYTNVEVFSHVYFSLTRVYMTLLMVAAMAVTMLAMMRKMYQNKKLNAIITVTSIVAFGVIITMLRTQTFVGDVAYMKAMIPHHSIAILNSKQANLKDPEVRKLAAGIIEGQEREIAEMKQMIERLSKEK